MKAWPDEFLFIMHTMLSQEDMDLLTLLAMENNKSSSEFLLDIVRQYLDEARDQIRFAELQDAAASAEMINENKIERMIVSNTVIW